jgi:hypothetical protein
MRPQVIACLKSRRMSPQDSVAHYRIASKLVEGGIGEPRPRAIPTRINVILNWFDFRVNRTSGLLRLQSLQERFCRGIDAT